MISNLYADTNPEHIRQAVELKATKPLHDGLAVLGTEYDDPAEEIIMKFVKN